MPSPRLARGRHSEVGAFYAVTTIAAERKPLFAAANSAAAVMERLCANDAEGHSESRAWVVMSDHVHWLFELSAGTLSICQQKFKSLSARAVRPASGSEGSVWQAGYYDHRLRSEEDLVAQARYIVENPARKRLAERWRDYPYAWCRWDLP